eukprot:765641-Hanusia_phi.AAC.3
MQATLLEQSERPMPDMAKKQPVVYSERSSNLDGCQAAQQIIPAIQNQMLLWAVFNALSLQFECFH